MKLVRLALTFSATMSVLSASTIATTAPVEDETPLSVLAENRQNCERASRIGMSDLEAIASALNMDPSTVAFSKTDWTKDNWGETSCVGTFRTAQGYKQCVVFALVADDRSQNAAVAVHRHWAFGNAACFGSFMPIPKG